MLETYDSPIYHLLSPGASILLIQISFIYQKRKINGYKGCWREHGSGHTSLLAHNMPITATHSLVL